MRLYGNHPLNPAFIQQELLRPGYGKMSKWSWRVLNYLYTWIRFVRHWPYDFNINEDYHCVVCGKPVLKRLLTCSDRKCWVEADQRDY